MIVLPLLQQSSYITHQPNGYVCEEACYDLLKRTIRLLPGDDKQFIDCLIDSDSTHEGKERVVKRDYL